MSNFVKQTLNSTDLQEFKRKKDSNDSFKYAKFSPFRKDVNQRQKDYDSPYPKPPIGRTTNNQSRRYSKMDRATREKQQRTVCNNCGIQGHSAIDCKEPIQSYGLIILDATHTKVLLIQRKDSFGYISLINNECLPTSSINAAAREMTQQEKEKIVCFDFESLWKDVINNHRLSNNGKVMEENKKRFNSYQIKSIVDQIPSEDLKTNNEWGFPKGRIKKREKWLDCSIREASEETGIPVNNITVLSDMPFMENIKGFDDKMYINVYYLAELNDNTFMNSIKAQKEEIKDVAWIEMANVEDFFDVSNAHHVKKKKKVIHQVKKYIKNELQVSE
jgi:ADP-ribose pyrophosphatase YjhB (NUDIX family)